MYSICLKFTPWDYILLVYNFPEFVKLFFWFLFIYFAMQFFLGEMHVRLHKVDIIYDFYSKFGNRFDTLLWLMLT